MDSKCLCVFRECKRWGKSKKQQRMARGEEERNCLQIKPFWKLPSQSITPESSHANLLLNQSLTIVNLLLCKSEQRHRNILLSWKCSVGEKSQQIIATKAARPCNSIFNTKTSIKKGYFQSIETILFFNLDGTRTLTLMHGSAWFTKLCYIAIIACQQKWRNCWINLALTCETLCYQTYPGYNDYYNNTCNFIINRIKVIYITCRLENSWKKWWEGLFTIASIFFRKWETETPKGTPLGSNNNYWLHKILKEFWTAYIVTIFCSNRTNNLIIKGVHKVGCSYCKGMNELTPSSLWFSYYLFLSCLCAGYWYTWWCGMLWAYRTRLWKQCSADGNNSYIWQVNKGIYCQYS